MQPQALGSKQLTDTFEWQLSLYQHAVQGSKKVVR